MTIADAVLPTGFPSGNIEPIYPRYRCACTGSAYPRHWPGARPCKGLEIVYFSHPAEAPSIKPIVAYYRVSIQKQARSGRNGSGLGLEAQREALERFAQANGLQIVTEFTEIETGKGAEVLELRPQLASALNMARKRKCSVAVAKLDRLSRDL